MPPLTQLTGNLTKSQAAHLLRRTTFGPSSEDILAFTGLSVNAALDILFATQPTPDPPIDPGTGTTWLNPRSSAGANQETLINYYMSWHLERMLKSGTNIKEKITFFYHSHLPARRSLIEESEAIYYQNIFFRYYAFGSFKELFRKICIDNAMLVYLDGATNESSSPNENFAREMFELYSIGRGEQVTEGNYSNYNEDDVKAATKLLTGWTNDDTYTNPDPDTGIPIGILQTFTSGTYQLANKHDPGTKQFSSAFGNESITPAEIIEGYATKEAAEEELDTLIDMIFDQDETARFITRKVYRYFMYREVNEAIVNQLAENFKAADYNMESLLRELLGSQHFYDTDNANVDDDNKGALIKSPIELIFGTIRAFNIEIAEITSNPSTVYNREYIPGILECIFRQGLDFYEPFEVAGYPAYHQFPGYNRNWITPHTLAYRYLFADLLIEGVNHDGEPLGFQLDILNWVQDTNHIGDPSNAGQLVDEMLELLIPFTVSSERRDHFLNDILLDGIYASAWTTEWNTYIADGSNESTIRPRLESLVRAIMKSPEFQLY